MLEIKKKEYIQPSFEVEENDFEPILISITGEDEDDSEKAKGTSNTFTFVGSFSDEDLL